MAWFEFIRLSTTAERARELSPVLAGTARELRQASGVSECFLLRHASYEGHLALALVHRDSGRAEQTMAALAVADHLRNFGMVDHQVWSLVAPDEPRSVAPSGQQGQAGIPGSGRCATGRREP